MAFAQASQSLGMQATVFAVRLPSVQCDTLCDDCDVLTLEDFRRHCRTYGRRKALGSDLWVALSWRPCLALFCVCFWAGCGCASFSAGGRRGSVGTSWPLFPDPLPPITVRSLRPHMLYMMWAAIWRPRVVRPWEVAGCPLVILDGPCECWGGCLGGRKIGIGSGWAGVSQATD